jgi:hypothetical protein
VFENDHIRAVEYTVSGPEGVSPAMSGSCLLVPLTPAVLRIDGGEPTILQEYEVFWSDSGIRSIEADGPTAARFLVAELKGDGPAEPPAVAEDNAMLVEPDAYRLIFENHRARVAWVTNSPGDKTVMHSHPARVFRHVIASHHLLATLPNGDTQDIKPVAGTAFWRDDAMAHATESVGDTDGALVLIEVR